jgi:hypothetical protein
MTGKQLRRYVDRYFPSLHAQTCDHGRNRGSVQVFDATGLLVDVDTRLIDGRHDLTGADLGAIIRNRPLWPSEQRRKQARS